MTLINPENLAVINAAGFAGLHVVIITAYGIDLE